MNRIFKVIYSKTKHCFVVVSELAKNQRKCHSVNVKRKTALAAAVLLALTSFCLPGMPSVAQAADGTESMKNNDYVGANGYYWYFDEKTNQWTKYPYKISSINNNRSWKELPNYEGGGAKEPGAVTAGLYAQAGEQTVTIGNRNAGQSKGSVFIGELDGYNNGEENDPVGMRNNYVTAVGFQSKATGWGSIAIGSNAVAENTQETSQVVDYEGSAGTSGTVQDDNYGIKLNPSIQWSSVALGYSAKAKDGNIAIGAYSDATDTTSSTPYVSVGGTMTNSDGSTTKILRKITNVADGSGDSDVATVGQMNKAIASVGAASGWTLTTNGSTDSSTAIKAGTTVDFSEKAGNTGNLVISHDESNVAIGLNKDLKGITSITSQTETAATGGKIELGTDGTKISGGDVDVSGNKVTGLKDAEGDTDAVTLKQLNAVKTSADTGLAGKANVAADNIGTKLNAGSTDEEKAAQQTNLNAWGTAIGTGAVAKDNGQLVTGGTVYDYSKPVAEDGKTLNYVSGANTTGKNLGVLDEHVKANADSIGTNTTNITRLTNLSNITEEGKTVIKNLSKDAVKVAAGDRVTVTDSTDDATGAITYTVSAKNDGKVAAGDTNLVSGDTVNTAITNATSAADTKLAGKANVAADNIGTKLNAGSTDEEKAAQQTNLNAWGTAIGTGAVAKDNGQLVTGGTVYNAMLTKANIDLDNISDGGKTVIRDLAKGAVKVVDGSHTYVTSKDDGNATAYAVNIKTGQVASGVSDLVTGGTVYDAIQSAKISGTGGADVDLTGKAEVGAGNVGANFNKFSANDLTDEQKLAEKTTNENDWGTALGTGKITSSDGDTSVTDNNGSKQLVTGNTVYKEVRPSEDGTYVKTNNTTAQNLAALDAAAARGVLYDLTADKKVDTSKINLVGTDGTTIKNVKAGTDDTDAVNVKQLKDKISDVTYTAGNGIDLTNKVISAKGGTGITVDTKGINVNLGKHLAADDTTGAINVQDNGAVAKDDVNLVTGKTVYDALHGGLDDITIGHDGKDGKAGAAGSIGLVGPKGQDGFSTTIIKTETGAAGVDGENGITRIVYGEKDNSDDKHTVATLDDGLKFKGDSGEAIVKKLDDILEIIGGVTDSTKLTANNIGVTNAGGKLKIQLAQELNGIASIGNQKTVDGRTTGSKISLGDNGDVDVNGGKITNVGNGVDIDNTGKYAVTDSNKGNAANIGDVQHIVNDAVANASGLTNDALAKKADVNADNIGTKMTGTDAEKIANENAWGEAIGTGKIETNNGQLVTGKTVYDELRPKTDGGYVKASQTTGENLSALDKEIGKLNKDGSYIKKDDSISKNLSTLDNQVKTNADAIENNANAIDRNTKSIQDITNNMNTLSDNAVQYDKDSSKTKVTLKGEGGTTIDNVKDGTLSDTSKEAVNGKQLYTEQKAREAADNAISENVTNNTREITRIKDGEGFTDKGTTFIKNLSKDAVQVKAGERIRVDETTDEKTGNKTYKISAKNGTVAKNDDGLISGGTLYSEVHVDKDGSYIKSGNTVGQNLSTLDTGLKNTSGLIHTNAGGDTIHIGETSKATKVDVSSTDANGNKNGRVVTGVVTDAKDANSAANVGYVNGVTSATTQQLYRDMDSAYSRLDNNINRAAAGANALAALHPLDYDPDDKLNFAAGFGHYHNANAAAVGAFYYPNERTMINVGFTMGNGDPGVNAGVSFRLGKGSIYNGVSKAAMAQTIHDQSVEIDNLKKENQEMKQQIQEILKKLNG